MKININQKLKNLEGTQLKNETGKDLDLREVMLQSLLSMLEGDDRMAGGDKVKIWVISQKIHNSKDELEIDVEDLALIKERIGKMFMPIVVGQAWEMIG